MNNSYLVIATPPVSYGANTRRTKVVLLNEIRSGALDLPGTFAANK